MTEEQKRHRAIVNGAMRAKWAESMMRVCPNPAVLESFGTNKVCVWICKQCKFKHTYKWHGGISCDYGKDA